MSCSAASDQSSASSSASGSPSPRRIASCCADPIVPASSARPSGACHSRAGHDGPFSLGPASTFCLRRARPATARNDSPSRTCLAAWLGGTRDLLDERCRGAVPVLLRESVVAGFSRRASGSDTSCRDAHLLSRANETGGGSDRSDDRVIGQPVEREQAVERHPHPLERLAQHREMLLEIQEDAIFDLNGLRHSNEHRNNLRSRSRTPRSPAALPRCSRSTATR